MKPLGFLFLTTLCAVFPQLTHAQNPRQIQGEFIESSSPLPDGGSVTTRAEPGRRVQTTVTVASRPRTTDTIRPRTASAAAQPTPSGQSVLQSQAGSGTSGSAGSTLSQNQSEDRDRYPYPANYSARQALPVANAGNTAGIRTAQLNQLNQSNRTTVARFQAQNNNCCCCAPATTTPATNGLGLTPPPNFNQLPNTNTGFRTGFQNFQNGLQTGAQNFQTQFQNSQAGAQAQSPFFQPVLSQLPQQPNFNLAQLGGQNQFGFNQSQTTGRSPWFTGSPGAYQPLFRFFNAQPGTFLGQGILGQPEAFVNGKPLANFFRYLSPF